MSKKLFFVLLAANLIFLLWEIGHGGSGRSGMVNRVKPVKRLVLLKELKILPRKRRLPSEPLPLESPASRRGGLVERKEVLAGVAQGEPPNAEDVPEEPILEAEQEHPPVDTGEVVPANAVAVCERIGRFASRTLAEELLGRLTAEGIAGQIESDAVMENSGYWLMYPPVDTLEHARENFARFKARGMDDLWLFEQGAWKGAISMGMFSEQSRAQVVARRLREQGIEVEVKPKQELREVYWVVPDHPFPALLLDYLMPDQPFQDCVIQSVAAEAVSARDSGAASQAAELE